MILKQVRKLDAGLLVMGASDRSWWHEFVCGSVARTILRKASTPVLPCN